VKKVGAKEVNAKRARTIMAASLVAVAIVLGAIALFGGSDSEESVAKAPDSGEVTLTESELLAAVSKLNQPVYWTGPKAPTFTYELTKTPDGRIYVRYLLPHVEAGDPRPDFLTVGTYPVGEAKRSLKVASHETRENFAGEKLTLSHHPTYEVLSSKQAPSAYVVLDKEPELQIEVFSPNPGEADLLARSGSVRLVE